MQISGKPLKNSNKIQFRSYTDEKELNDKQVLIKNKVTKLIEEAM
jgi:hypothetical protein